MNKLFIVLLAVCLVSVHAFVKRDAEDLQRDALKKLEDIQKEVDAFLNPEQVKKALNDIVDKVSKAVDDMKSGLQPKTENKS